MNPQIRVKSARQLVYADNRANPNGRLPDNTWIIRPQDAPLSFSPAHDTWYFARVAGTFKEREGFHGCQMPEQLLARIIRSSSHPQELVLDPFGGSGTTMCVAKKLGRQWMGFELSEEYAKYIDQRLARTNVDDEIDGPEDPIQSAPSTAKGKQRKKGFNEKTQQAVIEAYEKSSDGYSADHLLCDKALNKQFFAQCKRQGIGGNATVWNRYLLSLRKSGVLPKSNKRTSPLSAEEMDRFGYASEIAWRLMAIDYQKTLDEILSSPDFAGEFDRIAENFGPNDSDVSSLDFRRAAVSIRKRANAARELATEKFGKWMQRSTKIPSVAINDSLDSLEQPGVFLMFQGDVCFYVGESPNMRARIKIALDNDHWNNLQPNRVGYVANDEGLATQYGLKSALVSRESPLLNCRLLADGSELSR